MEDFFIMCAKHGVSVRWKYNKDEDEPAGWWRLDLRKGDYRYACCFSTVEIKAMICPLSSILIDKLKNFIKEVDDDERKRLSGTFDENL